jgi:DNA-binding beta-propeller fold protein YncE
LFVIQHLPPLAPDRYRVRVCDLASGAIGPLATRLKTPVPVLAEEEMRGDGRQAVLAPNYRRLYTLYTHQPDHLHTRDLLAGRRGGDGVPIHAFVHVLSLDEGWAFCLDLPAPFGLGSPAAHTLALAPDGRRLFVADLASGRLAVADTETLEVKRVVALEGTRGDAGAAAAVEPDGRRLYLGGGASVMALDSYALTLTARWPVGAAIRGLAPSVDGKRLYVGQEGRVIGLDTTDGHELGRLTVPGLTSLRHVR